MKLKLLLIFLIAGRILLAQTFSENFTNEFIAVQWGDIAFSDINGDGNNDVLITGVDNTTTPVSKLYKNDGMGNFSEVVNTPFDGVWGSSIAFSDVNNDGSADVLITGCSSLSQEIVIAKLYINDGDGNFTESQGTPFAEVAFGAIAFSDVNNDGNDDVLITGSPNPSVINPIAKLYINDGSGKFTEMTGTPFIGVDVGSVAFSDVNNDGNEDVLITGSLELYSTDVRIAKLYINDGSGKFTEMTGTPFDGVMESSIAFSDINGDMTDDVLITGLNSDGVETTKLYANDGSSNFTEVGATPFSDVWLSSVAFSDINNDGNEDVLITGLAENDVLISKLYVNNGLGNFLEVTNAFFEPVNRSSVAFSDVNNDGYEDVLITGGTDTYSTGDPITKLYINDGLETSTSELRDNENLGFSVFPNPASLETVTINLKGITVESEQITVKIFGIDGSILKEQNMIIQSEQQAVSVDISSLPSGCFFVKLSCNQGNGACKLMIQK